MANKKTTNSAKKTVNYVSKASKKMGIGGIIIVVVLILSLAFLGFLFKSEISEVILSFKAEDTTSNANYVPNPSILGGSADILMPQELQEIGLEVHYIDVGQGDSILVRFDDGVDFLIDAGSGTQASRATIDKYIAYLQLVNVGTIDYMLATHPDADHVNMLDDVLDNFEVENIMFNYNPYVDDKNATATATLKTFIDKALNEGADVTLFDEDGDTYQIFGEEYSITIYSPGYARFEDVNDMSPIVVVEYSERRLVFTGDGETPTEAWFMSLFADSQFDCDIIKIGHHGSSTSSGQAFLEFASPEYAIISCGEDNSYKHPDPFTMNRLFNLGIVTYRTNRHGTIILYIDKEGSFAFGVQNEVPVENNKYNRETLMILKQ